MEGGRRRASMGASERRAADADRSVAPPDRSREGAARGGGAQGRVASFAPAARRVTDAAHN